MSLIKNLAKKSPFLKRLVRNYKSRTKQPAWSPLLHKDADLWASALLESQEDQKILIATSIGSHLAGTTLESTLAVALTLRGATIHVLLCDKVLPACMACWSDIFPDHEKFAKDGPSADCSACFTPASEMYRSLGVHVHRYSDFLSAEDTQEAARISASVPLQEIQNYSLNGIAIGEHAYAGALRFYARGDLNNEPYAEPVLRRFFNASLMTALVMQNALQTHRFTAAVFHHGIYVPQGLIGEVCRKEGVHVVNWNPGYRKHSFIFSHHDTYHHTMMSEPADTWLTIPWDKERESELMDYLKSRWEGTGDWIWFHEKPQFDVKKIAGDAGIDLSRPCIGLLTSVLWDAVLHYPSNAFPNMLDWIMQTIDYCIRRPDLQLIIRIHPAEIRGTLPTRQRVAHEIQKRYPVLPKNIIVITPGSNVSTYAVMQLCNAVIIYNTKTGIELAATGTPVIVAGEAWIRNKGFATEVDNPEAYFTGLDTLPFRERLNEETVLKAKKYAYHFFFRRMVPLEFMEPTGTNPPFTLNIRSLEDLLPGRSKGLDVICNGILEGSDFIYSP
jgi:hypothetical protein